MCGLMSGHHPPRVPPAQVNQWLSFQLVQWGCRKVWIAK